MKKIVIIPARGGSKRIPRKNIKNFFGKPIIAYSIETALKSALFDEVMVSTDDNEIAEVSEKYGAKIPFMRSERNSSDEATTVDVLLETIIEFEKRDREFDYLCCIYPTAPFVTPLTLKTGFSLLKNRNANTVIPIVKYSYPIQRALRIVSDKLEMINQENLNKNSQEFETTYHDAGQFYWADVKYLKNNKALFSNNSTYLILPETEVQDIDNETDWFLAEIKYELMMRQGIKSQTILNSDK